MNKTVNKTNKSISSNNDNKNCQANKIVKVLTIPFELHNPKNIGHSVEQSVCEYFNKPYVQDGSQAVKFSADLTLNNVGLQVKSYLASIQSHDKSDSVKAILESYYKQAKINFKYVLYVDSYEVAMIQRKKKSGSIPKELTAYLMPLKQFLQVIARYVKIRPSSSGTNAIRLELPKKCINDIISLNK